LITNAPTCVMIPRLMETATSKMLWIYAKWIFVEK